ELGRRALEPVKEAPQNLFLGLVLGAETEHSDVARSAQHTGYRDDPMLRQRQKFRGPRLLLLEEHDTGDVRVTDIVGKVVEPAAELDVGHGLDVEDERAHAAPPALRSSTATA